MFRLLILAFILGLIFTQQIDLDIKMGGYKPFNSLEDPQFKRALAFLYSIHPEVTNYSISSVGNQVVSGMNYKINLLSSEGCNVTAVVYVYFSIDITLTSFTNTCDDTKNPKIIPTIQPSFIQPNPPSKISAFAQPVLTYGVSVQNQTNNMIKPTLTKIDTFTQPVLTSGINAQNQANKITNNSLSSNTIEGYFKVTDKSQYSKELQYIYNKYPELKSYNLTSVQQQLIEGKNFIFYFNASAENLVALTTVKIYVDLQNSITVTQFTMIKVDKYTEEQVNTVIKAVAKKHSTILKDYTLQSVQNMSQNSLDLKLYYKNGNQSKKVYIRISDKSTREILYNLIY